MNEGPKGKPKCRTPIVPVKLLLGSHSSPL